MVETTQIDVIGVCCPVPLIQLAKSTQGMAAGELVEIIGNDPIFEQAVRDFCYSKGHEVLNVTRNDKNEVTVQFRIGG